MLFLLFQRSKLFFLLLGLFSVGLTLSGCASFGESGGSGFQNSKKPIGALARKAPSSFYRNGPPIAYASWTPQHLNRVQETIRTALRYQGTPYLWGGVTPKGFDCSGLIVYSFDKSLGMKPPVRVVADFAKLGAYVSIGRLRPGDIVFFDTGDGPFSHAGIYIGGQKFVHSSSSKGVTVSKFSPGTYFGLRYVGARRIIYSVPSG